MKLSVVILNYNVRYFLEQCILSVQQALKNIDGEIIVVDNNSKDESCQMVKDRFQDVILIENKTNTGFPKGNNIGVSVAKGEYLCILNPDTVVAEDTFEKILKYIEAHPNQNLGIIGPKLIDGSGKFLPESKRGIPTPWVAITKVLGLYKFFPKNKLFNKYYWMQLDENTIGETNILVGAFMFLKKDLYLNVGGFDEDCFMYSDDIDLSYLVLKTDRKNIYFPSTTVIHYKGESTARDAKYMKRFQEAMNFFYKKHFKTNFVFDVLMKIGIFFFSYIKKTQAKRVKSNPESFIVVTNQPNLIESFKSVFNKPTTTLSLIEFENWISNLTNQITETEIIFDQNYVSNRVIIQYMQHLSKHNFTFKILPKQSNFIIGSNDKDDRGEIIIINSQKKL